jgi:hypothetical protein
VNMSFKIFLWSSPSGPPLLFWQLRHSISFGNLDLQWESSE